MMYAQLGRAFQSSRQYNFSRITAILCTPVINTREEEEEDEKYNLHFHSTMKDSWHLHETYEYFVPFLFT
jgi:hypothetical protein